MTWTEFHVSLCFIPVLGKRKNTPDTPGRIFLPETKHLLGVKLYLCHNSQMKMHSEEFYFMSFFSLLSNLCFPLSFRQAAPRVSQLNQFLWWKVNLCLLNLVTFWLQWLLCCKIVNTHSVYIFLIIAHAFLPFTLKFFSIFYSAFGLCKPFHFFDLPFCPSLYFYSCC